MERALSCLGLRSGNLLLSVFSLLGLDLSAELAGSGLVGQSLLTQSLGLLAVDGLHEDTLVLELITLRCGIQIVVKVLVNLLGLAVLAEQSAEYTKTSHPQNLEGHSCVGRTLSLTIAFKLNKDAHFKQNIYQTNQKTYQCVCPWPWPPCVSGGEPWSE